LDGKGAVFLVGQWEYRVKRPQWYIFMGANGNMKDSRHAKKNQFIKNITDACVGKNFIKMGTVKIPVREFKTVVHVVWII